MISIKVIVTESHKNSYEYERVIPEHQVVLATSRYKVLEMIAQAIMDMAEEVVKDFTKKGWL